MDVIEVVEVVVVLEMMAEVTRHTRLQTASMYSPSRFQENIMPYWLPGPLAANI